MAAISATQFTYPNHSNRNTLSILSRNPPVFWSYLPQFNVPLASPFAFLKHGSPISQGDLLGKASAVVLFHWETVVLRTLSEMPRCHWATQAYYLASGRDPSSASILDVANQLQQMTKNRLSLPKTASIMDQLLFIHFLAHYSAALSCHFHMFGQDLERISTFRRYKYSYLLP